MLTWEPADFRRQPRADTFELVQPFYETGKPILIHAIMGYAPGVTSKCFTYIAYSGGYALDPLKKVVGSRHPRTCKNHKVSPYCVRAAFDGTAITGRQREWKIPNTQAAEAWSRAINNATTEDSFD
jgi:hypothetical protein